VRPRTETELVRSTDEWPPARPFGLELLDDDGHFGAIFGTPEAPAPELDLIERHVDRAFHLVIPVSFATVDQADRAGRILEMAFRKVRNIASEPVPVPEGCVHGRTRSVRFSRSTAQYSVCVDCNANLGEATD